MSYRIVLPAFLALLASSTVAAAQNTPAPPPAAAPSTTAPATTGSAPATAPAGGPVTIYVTTPAPTGPEELEDYDDSRPPPTGYVAERRTRKGLIIGGAVTFGVSYTLAVLVGAAGADLADSTGGRNQLTALFVPIIGPFIQMGQGATTAGHVILAGDGIAQAAGVAMFVVGLAVPRTVLVRKDLVGGIDVRATPILSKGMSGFGLSGTF